VRTRVGYAGGTTENPTYRRIGDHSETIQIDYDPTQISYEELLDVFWSSHNPLQPPYSRQYMSIIFYHGEEQRQLARASMEGQAAGTGREVLTELQPAAAFYLAEDYHQKYYLRRVPELVAEYRAIYPDLLDFVDSTATARANGYLGGNGSLGRLREELDQLGLSPAGSQLLLDQVRSLNHW